jgi:hypothetical protein
MVLLPSNGGHLSGDGQNLRNIFDQYKQPENRLTHALVSVLDQDRTLLGPFLAWLGVENVPAKQFLKLTQRQLPGVVLDDAETLDRKGISDAAIFDAEGFAVLFECKVQARVSLEQLDRHRSTARRNGYESPWIVVISVEELSSDLPDKTPSKTWREIFSWFNQRTDRSFWANQPVEYMKTFERKMLAADYQIRGTITVFDGLRFSDDNHYSYREAKRLIRLMGDLLQSRKDLHQLGGAPSGTRRTAITGKGTDMVWDFLPLKAARHATNFTAHPHLTMGLSRKHALAALTIPNGVKGGFRSKLKDLGIEGFLELVTAIEANLRPTLKSSIGAKPMIYATQRHYKSQRSNAEVDGRIDADLRTAIRLKGSMVKYQPEWVESIYNFVVNKRSNIQLGFDISFQYQCPLVQSPGVVDLFANKWKAMEPILEFVS